ncbi:MAG: HEAT repeat domain-containing protein, partial [Planctomycetota bacterium]
MTARYALALLLLSAPLAAQEGLRTYVKERRRLKRAADRYWSAFRTRENHALAIFRKPWLVTTEPGYDRTKTRHGKIRDFSEYRKLYMDYVKIESALGEAQIALARSEHPRALKALFDEFWDFADRVDAVERDLWKQKPAGGWGWFEQRHGVLRHGLAVRRPLLLRALATAPGGVQHIAAGALDRARKRDGARSLERRVGLVDALGMSDQPAARLVLGALLRADQTYIRIAALEALIGFDGSPVALEPLLRDKSPIVRRALLAAIRKDSAPSWIGPVLKRYLGARHLER